ncbi:MAG: origin recognition complex, subunit 2 [Piptocephalis tieghemiana]|nr:MAG: origin recognition complex, subunit 2 [Piptocephalis tieghemiana]
MPQGTPRRTFASLTRQHTSKNTFTAARLAKSLVELKEGKGETEAINASVRSGGSVVSRHPQERQFLADYLRDQFPQWLFELNAGFNLCFYGYGSKKELMEAFVQEMCLDGPTVVVYGYAASASIKEILTGLLDLLGIKKPSTTRPWRISRVSQLSGRSRRIPRLYLLIHNLDGPGISSPQAQEILLSLASIPNISLLASVDHINAGLLLNPGSFASTSFLFHDATTFTPYITEQSAHASLILRLTMAGNGSASVNKHSAQLVLASLTDNARDLFRMLGKACIDSALTSSGPGQDGEEGSGTERGITYEELFSRCRSAFIVNSEATFKSILGEFRDHELLTEIRGSDGSDVLSIPLTMDDLKDLCAPGGM